MFVATRKIATQLSARFDDDDEDLQAVIPRGSLLGMDNLVFSRPFNLDTIMVSLGENTTFTIVTSSF
jgi:hypothetical protein